MRIISLLALPFVLVAQSSLAAATEKASFIEGTYATDEGCRKLALLEAGTEKSIETVPEVLTNEGFKGWESACTFTKVFEHEPGKSWIALLLCREGETMTPLTYAFARGEDGSIEVGGGGDDKPEVFRRCDVGGEKK